MRIAYIITWFEDDSVVTLNKRFAEYFIAQGHYVKFFYFDYISEVKLPCEAEQISMNKPIDFDSFDIIHANYYRPDKYLYKYRKQIKKAKTLCTIHCDLFQDLRFSHGWVVASLFTPIWKRYIASHDTAVQISPWLLRLYLKSIPKSRLVYNAVDVSFDNVSSHRPIEEKVSDFKRRGFKVVCSYSILNKRKGLSQILYALAKDSSLAYVCIGDGKEKMHLKSLAASLGVTDRCAFFCFQKNPYLIMRYADVFCIPSYSEGFSLAMLEAGSVGSSVVCSNIGAFNAVFSKDEVTFFELDNIDSLVNAINVALEQKMQKAKILKERIERDFSCERMLSGYASVYESLLAPSVSVIQGGGVAIS